MKRIINILISLSIVFTVCLGLCGCNTLENNDDVVIVVDMENNTVVIPKSVNHVACISPSATDFMISFGLGEKITGVYTFLMLNSWLTEIYPQAKNYKRYDYEVSAEELLADGIDLVISQDPRSANAWRNAGIPVVIVHQYSETGPFDDEVYDTARIIGEIFGDEIKQKAEVWEKDAKDTIDEIRTKIGTTKSDKSMYYVNGAKSKGLYYSDGMNTMIERVCDIANIHLATEQYKATQVHSVSEEELVKLNPYAMMISGVYQNYLFDLLDKSALWSSLDCYKQNRIYRIPVGFVTIENLSCETPVMMNYVASLFNDNYEYDVIEGLRQNIKKYFGYNLTKEDAMNMCMGLDKNGQEMVKISR